MSATLDSMREFLGDLSDRRGDITKGGNPVSMIAELYGGEMVELLAFEPDASTYRQPFYYNTVLNCLYKLVLTEKSAKGNIAHWKRVSV
jgi:hypothetical protein